LRNPRDFTVLAATQLSKAFSRHKKVARMRAACDPPTWQTCRLFHWCQQLASAEVWHPHCPLAWRNRRAWC